MPEQIPNAPSNTLFNLGTVIDDAKKVIMNPVDFYQEMPISGGYANPLIFALVIAVITGLIMALLGTLSIGPYGMMGAAAFGMIIILPIAMLIGLFIGAAFLFVLWKLMGSDKTYEVAFRCSAYATGIAPVSIILSVIPYLGGVIQTLWGCFLMFVASVEVHAIRAKTAKIVFGISAALGVLFGIGGEIAQRNLQDHFEEISRDLPTGAFKGLEGLENMSPEEAGEKMGEFLKGLEKTMKETQKQ